MVPRGWAQPPQGPRERRPRIPRPVRETPPGLGRHIPRRTSPREHALERPPKPRSLLLPVGPVCPPQSLPVLPGLSDSHRQLPPRPQSAWACAPPTPLRGPAPRDSPAAAEQARAHLPPTPPAAKPRTAPPGPASARDAAGACCARLRGHAQFPPPSERPRLPIPSLLYGRAENSGLESLLLDRNVVRLERQTLGLRPSVSLSGQYRDP